MEAGGPLSETVPPCHIKINIQADPLPSPGPIFQACRLASIAEHGSSFGSSRALAASVWEPLPAGLCLILQSDKGTLWWGVSPGLYQSCFCRSPELGWKSFENSRHYFIATWLRCHAC